MHTLLRTYCTSEFRKNPDQKDISLGRSCFPPSSCSLVSFPRCSHHTITRLTTPPRPVVVPWVVLKYKTVGVGCQAHGAYDHAIGHRRRADSPNPSHAGSRRPKIRSTERRYRTDPTIPRFSWLIDTQTYIGQLEILNRRYSGACDDTNKERLARSKLEAEVEALQNRAQLLQRSVVRASIILLRYMP